MLASPSNAGVYGDCLSVRVEQLVYICDWLPPDFGAVGQYAEIFARRWKEQGAKVTLVGLSSESSSDINLADLRTIRVFRPTYDKTRLLRRAVWTIATNLKLIWAARQPILESDTILFTGSPPFMIHFLVPLNAILRKRLIYRITDFHPECLMAERTTHSSALRFLLRLTIFWRKRVDMFEALGNDQVRRLRSIGIQGVRIVLKRDPSPVCFDDSVRPLEIPLTLQGRRTILYSGNWGVAHDHETFVEGFKQYSSKHPTTLGLWLNATGAKAAVVYAALQAAELAVHRTDLVPLADLPSLLVTPDIHLITLTDSFVGYVLPSKVHACLESGKAVLFIGSKDSDVHELCSAHLSSTMYRRVDTGDANGVVTALEALVTGTQN